MLFRSTLHWVGDRRGSISAGAVAKYAGAMVGYDLVNGVYNSDGQGGVERLTLSTRVQNAALTGLYGRKGTVAVYNYKTGEILCAVTSPTYDPDNGTGKFSLSQISHIRSLRRNNRFVFANCKMMAEKPVMKWGAKEKSQFRHILRSMAKDAQSGTLYFHEIDRKSVV